MIVAILGATAIYFILEFTRKGILQAGVVSLLYLAALVVTMVSTDVFARPKKKTDKTCLYVALGLLALITLLS
jgi:cell division protein FtsX